jgi:hypothetical protein
MKKLAILMMIASSVFLADRAEAGLVWTATARISVIQRPALEGTAFVKVRGIHRVTVTNMGMYTDVVLWIDSGSIEFNGAAESVCSTGWKKFDDVATVRCSTFYQGPCDSGIWEALTLAKVRVATFFTKTQIAMAEPVFVNCSCV